MPVDGVLLNLHGAIVADGYDDCEGDILARCARSGPERADRRRVDPHCHVTPLIVEQATALVLYKEFPHTHFAARAEDLFRLIVTRPSAGRGPTWPLGLPDARQLLHAPQPVKGFVDDVKALEGRDGVLSISPSTLFPTATAGDRDEDAGDHGRAARRGARLAKRLGLRWIALRGRTIPRC